MIIVGLHNTGNTSSACISRNGIPVFAAAEERYTRRKHDKYFPCAAIATGLEAIGATMDDVDCLSVAWNPAINLAGRYRAGHSEWPGFAGERFYSNLHQVLPRLTAKPETVTQQLVTLDTGRTLRFDYVDHHLAHATLSFLTSPFEEAAILIIDGYGERACTVLAKGQGTSIEVIHRELFPNSIGSLYSAITQHLGFWPDQDEWKVMGAAAFGDPAAYRKAMRSLVAATPDGGYRLDLNLFEHFDFDSPWMLSPGGRALVGPKRQANEEMEQRHFDLAAAVQERTEEILVQLLSRLRRETGLASVCLGGGVAMNSVFNGKATSMGLFDRIHIPFAPDDSGNSIGAALDSARRMGTPPRDLRTPISPYLGNAHDDLEISATLKRYGLSSRHVDDPAQVAADLLAQGKVLGWFQGRMEFGQRALGNRSILGDPRDVLMRDKFNAKVKYRESFRPFAPAVLRERASEFFDLPPNHTVPYMESVFQVRPEFWEKIPAVVHTDGSGRLQTVCASENGLFHDLIDAFGARTGVPVVLNTSFNTAGEPIVATPDDALRTFFTSGLDALLLGHHLVQK